jgi:hypothetical protein
LLLRSARANQVADNHQSGGNADPALKGRMCLHAAYGSYKFKPSPHGSLGIVLVGLGIPEIDQNAIAHVLRHEAAEALHGVGDALLVGRNDLAEILGVHASRQGR